MSKLEYGFSKHLNEFTYSLLYRNAKNYTIYRSNVNEYIQNNSVFVNLDIRFFGSSFEFLISSYTFAFIYFLIKVIYFKEQKSKKIEIFFNKLKSKLRRGYKGFSGLIR